MNSKKFSEAMGEIGDKYVNEAISYQKKRKSQSWVKWASIAACFCIIVGTAFFTNQKPTDTVLQLYFTDEPQQLILEFVEWRYDEGFKAIVINGDEQELFPKDGKLTVIFEDTTEIILEDGTLFKYSEDNPNASEIEWEEGCEIIVTFTVYSEYLPGNNFYNCVYATKVEQVNP